METIEDLKLTKSTEEPKAKPNRIPLNPKLRNFFGKY